MGEIFCQKYVQVRVVYIYEHYRAARHRTQLRVAELDVFKLPVTDVCLCLACVAVVAGARRLAHRVRAQAAAAGAESLLQGAREHPARREAPPREPQAALRLVGQYLGQYLSTACSPATYHQYFP